jgi:hypothetical protein
MGGGNIAQQHFKAELLAGTRSPRARRPGRRNRPVDNLGNQPIKLQRIEVIDAPEVTHLRFRATLP